MAIKWKQLMDLLEKDGWYEVRQSSTIEKF